MVTKKQPSVVALPSAPPRRLTKPANRLAALQQSEQWQQLPRAVQRSYEASENQGAALLRAMEQHGEAVEQTRARSLDGIVASSREWQGFIDDLGDSVSDEERQALIIAKSNELAALLTSHQTGLDTLNELLEAQLHEAMSRPAHEWTKRTLEDELEDLLTLGEAELERRGYPPLTFWEAVANTFTFGAVADKRLREYERARLLPRMQMPIEDADGDEEVIDVDFTPR